MQIRDLSILDHFIISPSITIIKSWALITTTVSVEGRTIRYAPVGNLINAYLIRALGKSLQKTNLYLFVQTKSIVLRTNASQLKHKDFKYTLLSSRVHLGAHSSKKAVEGMNLGETIIDHINEREGANRGF